jgi:hypothetical protein
MASETMPAADATNSRRAHLAEEEHGDEEDPTSDMEETINPADLYNRPKPAPQEWIELSLEAINEIRIMHWTPPLIWSELCYEYAKRQADTCMAKKKPLRGLNDTIQGRLGQCILGPLDGGGPWRMNRKGCAEKIMELWYKEMSSYKFDHPAHHEASANFEQLVWFGTTSMGMAISKDGRYVVANFYPAGPDSHLEPPGEKGRRNYFPGGKDSSGRVLDLTKHDKYRSWFKANVLPRRDGPAPWLGGVERVQSPPGERQRTPGSRAQSPGSPGGRMRSASPKSKARAKGGKKGKAQPKSPSRANSRGSGRALSRSSSRKSVSPGPGDSRKKEGMKLMKPNSPKSPSREASRGASRGKSPKSPKARSPSSSKGFKGFKQLDL